MSCCNVLGEMLDLQCSIHKDPWDCADMLITRHGDGLVMPLRDGGGSFFKVDFCPFCGASTAWASQRGSRRKKKA